MLQLASARSWCRSATEPGAVDEAREPALVGEQVAARIAMRDHEVLAGGTARQNLREEVGGAAALAFRVEIAFVDEAGLQASPGEGDAAGERAVERTAGHIQAMQVAELLRRRSDDVSGPRSSDEARSRPRTAVVSSQSCPASRVSARTLGQAGPLTANQRSRAASSDSSLSEPAGPVFTKSVRRPLAARRKTGRRNGRWFAPPRNSRPGLPAKPPGRRKAGRCSSLVGCRNGGRCPLERPAPVLAIGNWGERLVGVRGFEPPAPASRTQCSTRLSYTPTAGLYSAKAKGPQGILRVRYSGVIPAKAGIHLADATAVRMDRGFRRDDEKGGIDEGGRRSCAAAAQWARSMQKSTASSSACFSALSGKMPSASRAMAP